MKKKYLGLAVTSTLAFSMLATSAFAVNNADLLDGLDSTDFALATHAHSTSDVTGLDAELATKADQSDLDTAVTILEIADENPILPVNGSEPYTCEAADTGAIALTSLFTTCVCTGSNWVQTADGTTECIWNIPTVTSAGQVWMDRNLGASRVATSPTDSAAYGDLYQWGRGADGHQLRTSGTTLILSTSDDPGHGDFIIGSPTTDWRDPKNDNLWQGVEGINNPCPDGFRLPTISELETERLSWSSNDHLGAYGSPLKLVTGGIRWQNGEINLDDRYGYYWSGTATEGYSDEHADYISFADTGTGRNDTDRAYGMSVRCIQD